MAPLGIIEFYEKTPVLRHLLKEKQAIFHHTIDKHLILKVCNMLVEDDSLKLEISECFYTKYPVD